MVEGDSEKLFPQTPPYFLRLSLPDGEKIGMCLGNDLGVSRKAEDFGSRSACFAHLVNASSSGGAKNTLPTSLCITRIEECVEGPELRGYK